ncbi:hypothetical protein [Hydrogenophaga sp. OTU3427]|uniref:hypothetical protein n=1 Tax=Hydrogenophaga sp. OTU3427 TaxID=3043856 RepID=UPI00313B32F1
MTEKSTPTLRQALAAVDNMENLSNSASEKVQGLCRLALHALETPSGQSDTEAIAQALRVILHTTAEVADCIGWEAEKVGVFAAEDAGQQRRSVARCCVGRADSVPGEGVGHG